MAKTTYKTEQDFRSSENYGNYLKKHPAALKLRKAAVAEENKGLTPCQSDEVCETCGSYSEHPVTAYCFICNADNWKLIRW